MRESGKKARSVVRASTACLRAHTAKVSSRMESHMGMQLTLPMNSSTRDTGTQESFMAGVNKLSLTALNTKENSRTISLMDTGLKFFQTRRSCKAIGTKE